MNVLFEIFHFIDQIFGVVLPGSIRLLLWGTICGAASIGIYIYFSDQDGLAEIKREMNDVREEMLEADPDSFFPLAIENLKISLQMLQKVFFPGLLSALPILVTVFWLSNHYEQRQLFFEQMPSSLGTWQIPFFLMVFVVVIGVRFMADVE